MNFPVAAERTSTALFPLTAAILLPPGDQASALTLPGKPKRKSLSSPVPILQESIVSLPSAAARCMLSEDQARASTLCRSLQKEPAHFHDREVSSLPDTWQDQGQ